MEAQKNNSVKDQSGNKSRPMLANRLFRGYSKKHNNWIYGNLINTPEKQTRIINYTDIINDGVDNFVTINELVETNSIGQFTSSIDKNAETICEGDILSKVEIEKLGINIQYFYVVKWSSSNDGYRCIQYKLDEDENGVYWRKIDSSSAISMVISYNHIIGTVFENQHLFSRDVE